MKYFFTILSALILFGCVPDSESTVIISLHGGNWESRNWEPFDFIQGDYVLLNYVLTVDPEYIDEAQNLLIIQEAVTESRQGYDRVYLVGTSYGGTLALSYALRSHGVDKVIAIAPPTDGLPRAEISCPVCVIYNRFDNVVSYDNTGYYVGLGWDMEFHVVESESGHAFFNEVTNIVLEFLE